MRTFFLILNIASSILLLQCKSKDEAKAPPLNLKFDIPQPNFSPTDVVVYTDANSIYGEWHYISTNLFYTAMLKIYRNGTFQYFDQSCLGNRFTEGKWINSGLNQVLTSFDKYKNGSNLAVDTTSIFFDKKTIRFKDGFLCEVDANGGLSESTYFQTENYR